MNAPLKSQLTGVPWALSAPQKTGDGKPQQTTQ